MEAHKRNDSAFARTVHTFWSGRKDTVSTAFYMQLKFERTINWSTEKYYYFLSKFLDLFVEGFSFSHNEIAKWIKTFWVMRWIYFQYTVFFMWNNHGDHCWPSLLFFLSFCLYLICMVLFFDRPFLHSIQWICKCLIFICHYGHLCNEHTDDMLLLWHMIEQRKNSEKIVSIFRIFHRNLTFRSSLLVACISF